MQCEIKGSVVLGCSGAAGSLWGVAAWFVVRCGIKGSIALGCSSPAGSLAAGSLWLTAVWLRCGAE